MPIFYNFYIHLAAFYTIFGTNILIQCPVPVPVCCMFFVSQKTHIKRSPNGIKMDGDFFWNICEFWEVESTREDARGAHEAGGRCAPNPRGHPVRRLVPFFHRKKANIWIEIISKAQLGMAPVGYGYRWSYPIPLPIHPELTHHPYPYLSRV